jgi:hypothetical protein
MSDDVGNKERNARSVREERLKAALRDNLKRRKSQARGRAGMAIVTPEDDARTREPVPDPAAVPRRQDG